MTFEIWDMESRNLLGAYDSEEEALNVVRDVISTNGYRVAEQLALVREDESGDSAAVAHGKALVHRAEAPGWGARRRKPSPLAG